jgi:hypothetical protein
LQAAGEPLRHLPVRDLAIEQGSGPRDGVAATLVKLDDRLARVDDDLAGALPGRDLLERLDDRGADPLAALVLARGDETDLRPMRTAAVNAADADDFTVCSEREQMLRGFLERVALGAPRLA